MTDYLSAFTVPMTVLQGVNLVLETTGQGQLGSLEAASASPSGLSALNYIGDAMRECLEEGWSFNTLYGVTIDPNGAGEISLPANCMRVRNVYAPNSWSKKIVQRGGRLFDTTNNTYNIGVPVKLDIIQAVTFEETPQAFRRYVSVVACRRAASIRAASSTAYQFTKADEGIARLRLEQSEGDWEDATMNSNPQIRRWRRR